MSEAKTVLFLCTGNYYRSRFAEIYFNHRAAGNNFPWKAVSAGLLADRDLGNVGPISSLSVEALERLGVAVPELPRWPRQVREADLHAAELTVAVKEAEHRPMLRAQFPEWEDRVRYWSVHDLDQATPEEALAQLVAAVDRLQAELSIA
jgi:protein-tyrosine-phosphatase